MTPLLRPVLEAIGTLPDDEIDLADAALQLARVDAPDADLTAARSHLSALARDAARSAAAADSNDLQGRAKALSNLLSDHYDYRGDIETYDDLANANLLHVIDRRRGLPVALGILWLHAAQAAGWPAYGMDIPGHFVIALSNDYHRRLVLDVFDGGAPLDDKAVKRLIRRLTGTRTGIDVDAELPMSRRDILMRLQSNIRLRRLQTGDLDGALDCAEATLCVAPKASGLWLEAARLQQRLDRIGAALHSYEQFLSLARGKAVPPDVRAIVDDLRTRLN